MNRTDPPVDPTEAAASAGDSSTDPSPSATPDPTSSVSPSPTTSPSPLPAALVGIWTTKCGGTNRVSEYLVTEYTFDENSNYTGGNKHYSDSGCTHLIDNSTATGSVSLGPDVSSGSRNIDLSAGIFSKGIYEVMGDTLYLSDFVRGSSARPTSYTFIPLHKVGSDGSNTPLTLANLVGTWSTSDCHGGSVGNKYYTDTYVIAADGGIDYSYNIFTNDTCTASDTPATGGPTHGSIVLEDYTAGDDIRKMTVSIAAGGVFSWATSYSQFEFSGATKLWFSSMRFSSAERTSLDKTYVNVDVTYIKTSP